MGRIGRRDGDAAASAVGIAELVDGIARVAGALAELPAVAVRCLPEGERERVATSLAAGWDLAAFTPTGAALMQVLDAGGARIEVVADRAGERRRGAGGEGIEGIEGAEGTEGNEGNEGTHGDATRGDAGFPRATSHGATRAARGAPPGRRVAAMGLVPGPSGALVQMSVGLVLRLPVSALADAVEVARTLAWHAAMHAAERMRMPAEPVLAASLAALDAEYAVPPGPRGRVAWATELADRVLAELGIDALRRHAATELDEAGAGLRDQDSHL